MKVICRSVGMAVVLGAGAPMFAETIAWFSNANSVNQVSGGGLMNGDFVFELGVFSGGFEPGLSNRSQWMSHWVAAQTTAYVSGTSRFAKQFTVSNNNAPFVIGAKGWILGRRTTSTGSEWILFRSASWLWPDPDPLNPFSIDWNAGDADQVLAGEVDGDGSPFLMKSEAVRSYAQWQTALLSGEPLDGVDDDPDKDGVSNIVEFLAGTLPKDGASKPTTGLVFVNQGGSDYLQATFDFDPGSLAVWSVQVSSDLDEWLSGPTNVNVQAGSSIVATDLTPVVPGGRRFVRMQISVP